MGVLTYIPTIFRTPSPEQDELMSDKAELEDTISHLVLICTRRLATTSAAEHVGGIDKENAAGLIEECLRDIMFEPINWLDTRLEELGQ